LETGNETVNAEAAGGILVNTDNQDFNQIQDKSAD